MGFTLDVYFNPEQEPNVKEIFSSMTSKPGSTLRGVSKSANCVKVASGNENELLLFYRRVLGLPIINKNPIAMVRKIDFEKIEQKLDAVLVSKEYELLIEKVKKCKKIFLLGNGGLSFTAAHAATDMTRLIPGKAIYSFESVGFITSNANDHGYDNLFIKWLETVCENVEIPDSTLIVGLSCSGNSKNVVSALSWARDSGYETFMVSGQKSKNLSKGIDEIVYGCDYFHTVEVLSLMMFYDLIHQCGYHCPTISAEITRKGYDDSLPTGAGVHIG